MSNVSHIGDSSAATDQTRSGSIGRAQKFAAMGGIIGALAASSCCILPVVLFSLGISGAWIGYFTQLAPYQRMIFMGTEGRIEVLIPFNAPNDRPTEIIVRRLRLNISLR